MTWLKAALAWLNSIEDRRDDEDKETIDKLVSVKHSSDKQENQELDDLNCGKRGKNER
jgi:hypothetical protein